MSYCKSIAETTLQQLDRRYLFGHRNVIELCLIAFLARGHALIEGPPGTGKTLTARLLSRVLSKSFKRIQFTSDMLPGDIIGAHIYSPGRSEFTFVPGPIFADFILADEINRTPPRTQSALLEAMEERSVTVEGKSFDLHSDFFVLATQNPQDFEGTFPLPEAQIDRFLFKIEVTHADKETDQEVLTQILNGTLPPPLDEIQHFSFDRERAEAEIRQVTVDQSILRYVSDILQKTRTAPMLSLGSSVRGGIALAKCSRILALLRGRTFVQPDDIKELIIPTLRHRIRLSAEAQVSDTTEIAVLQELVEQVPFPK